MEQSETKTQTKLKLYDDSKEDKHQADSIDSECASAEYERNISDEPQRKIARLNEPEITFNLNLNGTYKEQNFIEWLNRAWENSEDVKDMMTGAQFYSKPYQICLLPQLLESKNVCKELVNEMINTVQWSRKRMDLYEFYQSTDLSNMSECHLLTNFLQLLRRQVRPWLEKVTHLKLDYVSASCSMYTCGDYLLVHDDLLKDRQIAFIYYLSPWAGAEEWMEEKGGCLEIFNSNEQCFPQYPVQHKIAPKNNQFAFFKVGPRSFHQVGEVTTFDYPRLTINGWFHGATNVDLTAGTLSPFMRLNFQQPDINAKPHLEQLINNIYLKPSIQRSIQKRIEDNSEICLSEFFRREICDLALKQLLEDSELKWYRQGPANAQNYEVLNLDSASKILDQLIKLFKSNKMFELLCDFTDLDLYGSDAVTPTCSIEVQRWSHGDYTMLGDGVICEDNTLDLIYYLNAAEGAAIITYLSPEVKAQKQQSDKDVSDDEHSNDAHEDDESVLLTITPIDNALNIVYRCEGTTRFTKYISRNTPLEKGPIFIISCSYKE